MESNQHNDVAMTLRAQGYGGLSPQELPGAVTLSGALPATPEALEALTEAWRMTSEESGQEG
jgi:hypothetical protein